MIGNHYLLWIIIMIVFFFFFLLFIIIYYYRLNDHDLIDEIANDLMHKINQRNQYPTNTQPFAKV